MAKYLVIADTYTGGYGCEYTLFGVFDTRSEATQYILNYVPAEPDEYEDTPFDFFRFYEESRTIYIRPETGETVRKLRPRRGCTVGDSNYITKVLPISKEEYAQHFIKEFNGEPMYIGGYCE